MPLDQLLSADLYITHLHCNTSKMMFTINSLLAGRPVVTIKPSSGQPGFFISAVVVLGSTASVPLPLQPAATWLDFQP